MRAAATLQEFNSEELCDRKERISCVLHSTPSEWLLAEAMCSVCVGRGETISFSILSESFPSGKISVQIWHCIF